VEVVLNSRMTRLASRSGCRCGRFRLSSDAQQRSCGDTRREAVRDDELDVGGEPE
jgi:hypothetical protein